MLNAATAGIPEAMTYYIAKRHMPLRRLAGNGILLLFGLGIVAAALTVAASSFIAGGEAELALLVKLAALAIAPSLVVSGLRAIAAGLDAWGAITAERLLVALSRLGGIVGLLLIGHLDVVTATAVIAGSLVLGGLAYLPLLGRGMAAKRGSRVAASTPFSVTALFVYGGRFWIGSAAGIMLSRVDQMLMVPLSSTYELGLYAVAVSVAELPLVINSAIRDVLFTAESQSADDRRLTAGARISNLLTTVAALGVALLSLLFFEALFGSEFLPALPLTMVLLLAVVLGNHGSIAGIGLSARGRPGLRSAAESLGLVVNVMLVLALVPPLGAMGAAVATVAGGVAAAIWNLSALNRVYGVPWSSMLGVRRSDIVLMVDTAKRLIRRSQPQRDPEYAAADSGRSSTDSTFGGAGEP
jgi:O-antigen/teichoic acid export membrane protein